MWQHWSGALMLRSKCLLPPDEDIQPFLTWLHPRDLPRTACFALFLLCSSKMNHSFGDISPTTQSYHELKQVLLEQNQPTGPCGLSLVCPPPFPPQLHLGLAWGQTTPGDSHDTLEISEAMLPASSPPSRSGRWVLISVTVSEHKRKRAPLQLVRHKGPCTGSLALVPWKAESGTPRFVFSLPEIRSMTQPVKIFIILTSIYRALRQGKRKVEGRQKRRPLVIGVARIQAE